MHQFVRTSILYIIIFFFKHWIIYIYIYKYINWGFNISEIIDTSLLNSLLLSWDGILDKEYFIMMLYILLFPISPKHRKYQQHITIFEQYNDLVALAF
jgi:hypothetical protein